MRLLGVILFLLVAAPASAQQSQGMSQALVVSSCGGGTLPSGPVNQLTMDTTGRLCQSGIGSNVCSQATAYLARTTGGNEGGNAVNITALICGLVSDGVITGNMVTTGCGAPFDAIYVMAQQSKPDALLNLCGTSYAMADPGTGLPFVSYKGFTVSDNTVYLQTSLNPVTSPSLHYTQNNASFGFWAYAIIDTPNEVQMGIVTYNASAMATSMSGKFRANVNGAISFSSATGVPTTITKGLFVAERPDASNVYLYQNGVSSTAQALASATPGNQIFTIQGNYNLVNSQTGSAAFIGAVPGATMELAIYNRFRTYMTAVGVP